MLMVFGNDDRSRASEHGIFFSRRLSLPVQVVARALPAALARLEGKLDLRFPGFDCMHALPIKVVIAPSHHDRHHRLELWVDARAVRVEFFEGELRLEDVADDETVVGLVGRFNVPPALRPQGCDTSTLCELAERNLERIFDALATSSGLTVGSLLLHNKTVVKSNRSL